MASKDQRDEEDSPSSHWGSSRVENGSQSSPSPFIRALNQCTRWFLNRHVGQNSSSSSSSSK
ncbi:hypothetical protein NQZ68_039006 [Dissostichus eleginoides]|nr:hypothetical protein NQZ68_039006 [Dissostichus eleginoides]